MLRHDIRNNLVVIVCVIGPMHLNTVAFCALFELFEVFSKMRKDVLLGFGSKFAKLFPLRNGFRRPIPRDPHRPDQSIEMTLVFPVLNEKLGVFSLVHSMHFTLRSILERCEET